MSESWNKPAVVIMAKHHHKIETMKDVLELKITTINLQLKYSRVHKRAKSKVK